LFTLVVDDFGVKYVGREHADHLHEELLFVLFTLVVDDFGVKYVGREHADHLHEELLELYAVTVNWAGDQYCGLTPKCDYTE
jgi:hypothetical protein